MLIFLTCGFGGYGCGVVTVVSPLRLPPSSSMFCCRFSKLSDISPVLVQCRAGKFLVCGFANTKIVAPSTNVPIVAYCAATYGYFSILTLDEVLFVSQAAVALIFFEFCLHITIFIIDGSTFFASVGVLVVVIVSAGLCLS